MVINPMEDWVPERDGDRRSPPQATILDVLAEHRVLLSAAREEIKAAAIQRATHANEIEGLREAIAHSDAERAKLREELKTVLEIAANVKGAKWGFTLFAAVVGGAYAIIVGIAVLAEKIRSLASGFKP